MVPQPISCEETELGLNSLLFENRSRRTKEAAAAQTVSTDRLNRDHTVFPPEPTRTSPRPRWLGSGPGRGPRSRAGGARGWSGPGPLSPERTALPLWSRRGLDRCPGRTSCSWGPARDQPPPPLRSPAVVPGPLQGARPGSARLRPAAVCVVSSAATRNRTPG